MYPESSLAQDASRQRKNICNIPRDLSSEGLTTLLLTSEALRRLSGFVVTALREAQISPKHHSPARQGTVQYRHCSLNLPQHAHAHAPLTSFRVLPSAHHVCTRRSAVAGRNGGRSLGVKMGCWAARTAFSRLRRASLRGDPLRRAARRREERRADEGRAASFRTYSGATYILRAAQHSALRAVEFLRRGECAQMAPRAGQREGHKRI